MPNEAAWPWTQTSLDIRGGKGGAIDLMAIAVALGCAGRHTVSHELEGRPARWRRLKLLDVTVVIGGICSAADVFVDPASIVRLARGAAKCYD